jgi:hypothetical protein
MKIRSLIGAGIALSFVFSAVAQAVTITIPDSALIPTSQLYTEITPLLVRSDLFRT